MLLAWPMILSNISIPLLGFVDTAVVGHLASPQFLAGVALGAMVINLLFWLAGFLRMSTTGLSAQAFGKHDTEKAISILKQGLLCAWLIAVLLIVLSPVINHWFFPLLSGSTEAKAHAASYFSIRIWSAPAALSNMVLLAWLLAQQNSKATLQVVLINNLTNILLDIVFVVGFAWQVKGVAAASVVADYIALLIACALVAKKLTQLGWSFKKAKLLSVTNWSGFFKLNSDIFIRGVFLQSCFAWITIYGASLGDSVLSANAVLLNFLLLISFALDGYAYAIEAKIGRAFGAQQKRLVHRLVQVGIIAALIWGIFYSLLFLLIGSWIISLLTDLPTVLSEANRYLIWLVIIAPIASVSFVVDGIFVGLMRVKSMRNSMVISALIGFFAMHWMVSDWGNHGLWFAMLSFMFWRSATLLFSYWRFYKASFAQKRP